MELNAATALARILKMEGTEYLFCFPNGAIIDAAVLEGIRPISGRQERTIVHMADGYTRVHNGARIGVCAVQQGPGIENAFTGIAEAYNDSSPIFVIPGGASSERRGTADLFDATLNYRGVTKWVDSINQAARVPEFARRAFTKMRNGRRRPVMLELPIDVAAQPFDEAALDYAPVRTYRSAGDPDDVAAAVRALAEAKAPVVLAGQGVLWAEASTELVALAEALELPVLTTLLGKSAFPEDHPLSLGVGSANTTGPADALLTAADVVLAIGVSFNRTLAAVRVPNGKTIVHCTDDAGDLNAEHRTPLAVIGDAKLVLRQLCDEARRQGVRRASRRDEVRELHEAWLAAWMPRLTSGDVPINPHRIVWDLVHTVDLRNTIATHDSGTPRGQLAPFYPALAPRSFLGWGNSHQLGSALGLIMGAKLAAPEKLAVAFMGDTAFGMCGLDLETAVRERIPILAIVLNNARMGAYDRIQPIASERAGIDRVSGDYTTIATGLGCYAERIERPSEIVAALKRGIAQTEAGRPAVLEFMTQVDAVTSQPGRTVPGAPPRR